MYLENNENTTRINLNNEIIFAVKGEIVKENEVKMIENEKFLDLINININSMSSKVSMIETKIINKMKILLNKLMISKIDTSLLYTENSNPKLYWKIYMDVFVFDEIKMSLFQMISVGIKKALTNIKVPKIIIFENKLTKISEYDLLENYKELPKEETEYLIDLKVPNVDICSIINNQLYVDPCDEELLISPTVIYISELEGKILQVESIGDKVDPVLFCEINGKIGEIKL